MMTGEIGRLEGYRFVKSPPKYKRKLEPANDRGENFEGFMFKWRFWKDLKPVYRYLEDYLEDE